jgi:hypothetical protein
MSDSSPRHVGRPWQMAPYAPQVAQWLREDPNLSGAEILRRVRLAGYRGGKSAFYELVRQLRVPGSGYKRCPRCRALLRDIAEACRHCGLSLAATVPHPRVLGAEALQELRRETEAAGRRHAVAGSVIARYLVIAAPDRRELYEYFKRKFGPTTSIEVVGERRAADRRRHANGPALDRRSRDRRASAAVDADLRTFGFAIVIRD